jgi:hypothetical protein
MKFNGAETRKFPRLCITPPSIYCRAQFGDLRQGASLTGSKILPHRPVIAPISIRRGGVVRAMPNG